METEKINAELTALKHQINPHFFFNILNDLYGQAITKSEGIAVNISKLSSMMRYVLTEAKEEKVSLEQEINYLKSYIDLQTRRLTDKTKVAFQFKGNFENKNIPPLLFINFIENAFKYGVSTEIESSISISIEIKNNLLIMVVQNDKPRQLENKKISNYMGLKNVQRRLDLLYPNNYSINISNKPDFYLVELSINLT